MKQGIIPGDDAVSLRWRNGRTDSESRSATLLQQLLRRSAAPAGRLWRPRRNQGSGYGAPPPPQGGYGAPPPPPGGGYGAPRRRAATVSRRNRVATGSPHRHPVARWPATLRWLGRLRRPAAARRGNRGVRAVQRNRRQTAGHNALPFLRASVYAEDEATLALLAMLPRSPAAARNRNRPPPRSARMSRKRLPSCRASLRPRRGGASPSTTGSGSARVPVSVIRRPRSGRPIRIARGQTRCKSGCSRRARSLMPPHSPLSALMPRRSAGRSRSMVPEISRSRAS